MNAEVMNVNSNGRPGVSALPSPEVLLQADVLPICWRGVPLKPWSSGRDEMYLALTQYRREKRAWLSASENDLEVLPLVEASVLAGLQADTEASAEEKAAVDVEALIDWTRFAPTAARVLWLASMSYDQLMAMGPDAMLEAVALWQEERLPAEELRDGVRLALRLRTEWKQLVVLPRPEKGVGAKEDRAGN